MKHPIAIFAVSMIAGSAMFGYALSLKGAPLREAPAVRTGTTTVTRVVVLPEITITGDARPADLRTVQAADWSDLTEEPNPLVSKRLTDAQWEASVRGTNPRLGQRVSVSSCRRQALEQGGRPGARSVLVCD